MTRTEQWATALDFVCSNSIRKDLKLTATFANCLILLLFTKGAWQREKAAGATASDLNNLWFPTVDNLRNFLLKLTTELLSFFSSCKNALNLPITPRREH